MNQGAPRRPRHVTVLVPVHNGAATIALQAAALAAQRYDGPWDLLLVDNNSTDDGIDIAVRAFGDAAPVRVVKARDGQSVAYARNAGMRDAEGDLVLICDADDQVQAGWIEAMVAAASHADVVGGYNETALLNGGVRPRWRATIPRDALPGGHRPYAVGSNFAAWHDVIDALGGWDEVYVGCGEDVDFSWRAVAAGHRLVFAPDAVVAYRYRDAYRGIFRQSRAIGRSTVRLHQLHGADGDEETTAIAPALGWLISRATTLVGPSWRRKMWVRRAGLLRGVVEGRWGR